MMKITVLNNIKYAVQHIFVKQNLFYSVIYNEVHF